MKKYFKLLPIFLLLMVVCMGAVSAEDNGTIKGNANVLLASNTNDYTITESNYGDYFHDDGVLKGNVATGDTLTLSGNFTNKDFIIDKNITITGNNAIINKGSVVLKSGSSGSTISNLKIINLNIEDKQGILLSGVSNCLIINNDIYCAGLSSFPIALNPGSNYNVISGNMIKSGGISLEGSTKSTCAVVLGGAHNNIIKENYIEVDDANAIYLSQYGSGSFIGGKSNNNLILNNTVKCAVVPTSWCYGIQLMGSNNTADSNRVIGTYRGISGEDNTKVINNKLINITGKNYATGELTGGDYGIAVGKNSLVSNNELINCLIENAGIYAAENSTVQNNNIVINGIGIGVNANGDNVKVIDNTIKTVSGAGITQVGKLSGLIAENNNIDSESGIGIYLSKSSKSKYPSNIAISNNVISTSNQYAINAKDANKESYVIKGNTIKGSSTILTPDGEVVPDNEFEFDGKVYNIDPDSYHVFFDDNGNLINIDVKDGDILSFTGEFADKFPIISSSVKIVGDNALFRNSKFIVSSDNVWIENLNIINNNSNHLNTWGIYAEDVNRLMIVNNNISVTDKNAAYAIYLNNVNNATVKGNALYSSGDYLTYTVLGLGLEDSIIEGNTILTNGSGEVHAFEPSKCLNGDNSCLDGKNIIKEIYRTYGILLITSSNNQVKSNNVTVTSKLDRTVKEINGVLVTNSLVGIDAYFDSSNNVFDSNNVLVYGNDNYLYGMGVIGAETNSGSSEVSDHCQFTNNTIVVRGNHVATGIICGYNSDKILIKNNRIDVVGNYSAYGVTLEYAKNSNVTNNNVSLKSNVSYIVEMFDNQNNVISGNNLSSVGSYGFGIAGYGSSNNNISNNIISIKNNGSEEIEIGKHPDALGYGNAGVFFKVDSVGNKISKNNITSDKGYAVNLTGVSGNEVYNNYLKGETSAGNGAVLGSQNNEVNDNYGNEFKGISLNNATVGYLGSATLMADTGIDDDSETIVKFYVNGNYVGSANAVNGKVNLSVSITENVGKYAIAAEFLREGYNKVQTIAALTVEKGNVVVTVPEVTAKKGSSTTIKANVADTLGNKVKNVAVLFYRGSQYIGKATTDNNGVAQFSYAVPNGLSGKYDTLRAVTSESDNYNSGEGLSNICYYSAILESSDLVMNHKDGSSYSVRVTDAKGSPLSGVSVVFKVKSASYTKVTDGNGVASLPIGLAVGTYTLSATYNDVTVSNTVTVNPATSSNVPVLTASDLVMNHKDGSSYSVRVTDAKGSPLSGVSVVFKVKSASYTKVTDGNGVASLPIGLAVGTYTLSATYNDVTVSNTVTVKQAGSSDAGKPILVANDLVMVYKDGSSYSVRVTDGSGKALSGVSV
ncbi:MAG: right-handed parallel beta-helix repeat-containing protein, partial [Methanobrevibacter sp.]|uniref:right-handed parallel beta-helix repeat-containing protein n=1 Tax=Methanobrevibacter sp. TaxID=66852 RepID=UPI0026DF5CE1